MLCMSSGQDSIKFLRSVSLIPRELVGPVCAPGLGPHTVPKTRNSCTSSPAVKLGPGDKWFGLSYSLSSGPCLSYRSLFSPFTMRAINGDAIVPKVRKRARCEDDGSVDIDCGAEVLEDNMDLLPQLYLQSVEAKIWGIAAKGLNRVCQRFLIA